MKPTEKILYYKCLFFILDFDKKDMILWEGEEHYIPDFVQSQEK